MVASWRSGPAGLVSVGDVRGLNARSNIVAVPEPLTYDELQHTFVRLIQGKDGETLEVPGPLAPLAKVGAWVLNKMPGGDPFIKPWMIDRASDHYALNITRARTDLGWGTAALAARDAAEDGRDIAGLRAVVLAGPAR